VHGFQTDARGVVVCGSWRSTLLSQPAQKPAAARTLVRAGSLLDVKTGKLLDSQTLIVVGDTIQSIAPSAQVPRSRVMR